MLGRSNGDFPVLGYDRRIIQELRRLGWQVDVADIGGGFPLPSVAQRATALATLSAVPPGCPIVLDGLAFGALPEAGALRGRTPLIALVHQPLALDPDLDTKEALQPVYADDVAAAFAQILRQSQKPYPVYELAGPRVYSYEELLRTIARIAGLRPVLMRMPFALWDALAGLAEMLPQPPLTRNQVELMQIDTTASESLSGFRALRISPRSLEDELEAMLNRKQQKLGSGSG